MKLEQFRIQLAKVWVSEQLELVWQCRVLFPKRTKLSSKKAFLIFDINQASQGVRLSSRKPSGLKISHTVSSLIRKYIPSAIVFSILKNNKSRDWLIPLCMGKDQQAQWYIQLVGSRPPEINLFSSNSESYLRYGTKGVFTKKK